MSFQLHMKVSTICFPAGHCVRRGIQGHNLLSVRNICLHSSETPSQCHEYDASPVNSRVHQHSLKLVLPEGTSLSAMHFISPNLDALSILPLGAGNDTFY